jgi:hypothetical protein
VESVVPVEYNVFAKKLGKEFPQNSEGTTMQQDSKTAKQIKEKITIFSDDISKNFKKPCQKFVRQIVFGIQAAKDVKISNISRTLKEDIALIKTENRLSRNLSRYNFSERIGETLLNKAKYRIKAETVFALDLSDIHKEFARKMENLALVYDGSTGNKHSPGYWLCSVFGAEVDGEELLPLYQELFSQNAQDFDSENIRIMTAVDRVNAVAKQKGIWTIDRGGDREELFRHFLEKKLNFVIRMASTRKIMFNGEERNILDVARRSRLADEIEVSYNQNGQEDKKKVLVGSRRIELPFARGQQLTLIIVKGFGEEPLMLLTNLEGKRPEEILEIYLTRWKCEESFRFMKQTYHLEDVRVRSYQGLRNMACLVLAVFYFVSVELGKRLKLNILLKKIYAKAKRFFGIPSFKHYAIADGIYAFLVASIKGIDDLIQKPEPTLPLPFCET